jgi:4-hydroxybenzoate polyprenyltransferase
MKEYLSLVKFSHTIFALPFAMVGYTLAVVHPDHSFSWQTFFLVLICMITARNAAMAFNRYIDRYIDTKNPRTAVREIPSGIIKSKNALVFVLINVILFIATTYFLNPLCFYLSPVALMVVLGYSFTKRFTALCHLILGLGLAIAPVGAYLAVTATVDLLPVFYGLTVLFWVAGFDIIYALQDEDFDKEYYLYSIPATFGKGRSLKISEIFHLLSALFLILAAWILSESYINVGIIQWIGVAFFIALLYYQHTIVSAKDLSRINKAFFTTNGVASIVFGGLLIYDLIV